MSKIENHFLVPKHTLMPKDEAKKVLDQYAVKAEDLPIILVDDPAIKKTRAERGDIIKIERKIDDGKSSYYRIVVE